MLSLSNLNLHSPITQIHSPLLKDKQVSLFIKRDELIHPVIQGNKWRKLKYNLINAYDNNQQTLLSFGGAYSNHLHALAAAGKEFGFKTIGVIRGEFTPPLNPCLQDMSDWGMQLEYVTRLQYKQKTTQDFLADLEHKLGPFYLIPEGGNNQSGREGCAELLDELDTEYDYICCEIGSGATLSSLLLNNKNPNTQFLGFSVMKNTEIEKEFNENLPQKDILSKWKIIHQYHFGGFAKSTAELNDFIRQFKKIHNIQLEPVYSGKMLYGIEDLISQDHFKKQTKILAIHGGGLQGLRGFPQLNMNTKP